MKELIIEPLKGFGDIKFGMTSEEVIGILGLPSNNEEIESILVENDDASILYDYDDDNISVYFEGRQNPVVSSISTYNEDATLFGEFVYNMNPNQIKDLMKKNGYKDFDEEEQDGDICLIYDELMLDFYFNEDELIDVVWGVVVDF